MGRQAWGTDGHRAVRDKPDSGFGVESIRSSAQNRAGRRRFVLGAFSARGIQRWGHSALAESALAETGEPAGNTPLLDHAVNSTWCVGRMQSSEQGFQRIPSTFSEDLNPAVVKVSCPAR